MQAPDFLKAYMAKSQMKDLSDMSQERYQAILDKMRTLPEETLNQSQL
jgi:hypothetical protein